MIDFLKPFLSRIVGSVIAVFVAWLAAKNINVDGDTQQQAIAAIVGLGLAVFSALYSVIHKLIDKVVNPSDAAAKANVVHGEVIKDQAVR